MTRRPARSVSGEGAPAPVDVRLMGDDAAVRQLVAALRRAAHCGPASYRAMRGGEGTRAYLSIVVPPDVSGTKEG